jgi:GNAT superfamily N-acetyltransferase
MSSRRFATFERDAARAFARIGMTEIANDEPLPIAELEAFRTEARAWVLANVEDCPVAYLLSSVVDRCAHIDQVSVAAAYAHRGLGAALIDHLDARAAACGREALTLTTFRAVPWNAPYYSRLGFAVVDQSDQGPELRALIEGEKKSIPGNALRVAMRRPVWPPNGCEHLRARESVEVPPPPTGMTT